eukprot:6212650-Pleurochrysis_carterae.AAC.2
MRPQVIVLLPSLSGLRRTQNELSARLVPWSVCMHSQVRNSRCAARLDWGCAYQGGTGLKGTVCTVSDLFLPAAVRVSLSVSTQPYKFCAMPTNRSNWPSRYRRVHAP